MVRLLHLGIIILSLAIPVAALASDLTQINRLAPEGVWDKQNRVITVDLQKVKREIIPELEKRGLKPDQIFLEIDGGERNIQVPLSQDRVSYPSVSPNRQNDVRVVFKKDGKEVHVTEARLFESLAYPAVSKTNYADYPLPELIVPDSLVHKTGMDPSLVQVAAQLQHESVNWTVRPTANSKLRKAFEQDGSDLKLSLRFDQAHNPDGVKIFDEDTHHDLPSKLSDIYITGGAAFSWHFFDWDSEFVKRYARFYDPQLSEQMRKFKLASQDPKTGAIPRELRANLTPYQREYNVKLGVRTPNGEFYNPPLSGWSERQVVRWDPAKEKRDLPEMIRSLRAQRDWLVKAHGVKDANGKLLGFTWTNLGSGRDNAPRVLSSGGLGVDAMTYYKMMFDQEREFDLILGRWAAAENAAKQAEKIKDTINERYWNEKEGFYVDLADRGGGKYEQDSSITLPGFWPAMAHVPSARQLERMIHENIENPKRFGDPHFPPSVAKDNPAYRPEGMYWRGGAWPPDFVFLGDALFETGHRKEASELHQRILGSISLVSDAYRKGDSPFAAINHKISPDEAADMKARGTVMEFYGLKNEKGQEIPTWGHMIREDGSLHPTRTKFAGWGAAEPLESLRYVEGLDAIPAFAGPKKDSDRWVYTLLTDPEFSYQEVRDNPGLKALTDYLNAHAQASFDEFSAFLTSHRTAALNAQLSRLLHGYLEVSPTFDPEHKTEIRQIVYNGVRFDLRIDHLEGENHVRLSVLSPRKIRIQFNRNWTGQDGSSEPTDLPQASSPILELGGDQPAAELKLVPYCGK